MSLFNRNNPEKDMYYGPKKSRIVTGAKVALGALAVTALLVGGELYHECHTTNPTVAVCPITQALTKVVSCETGLQHQAKDLERYQSDRYTVTNVSYQEPRTYYTLPEGYTLDGSMGVKYVEIERSQEELEDGSIIFRYSLPDEAEITQGPDGRMVGVIRVEPTKVELPAGIYYQRYDDGSSIPWYGYFSYEDGQFTNELDDVPSKKSLGR